MAVAPVNSLVADAERKLREHPRSPDLTWEERLRRRGLVGRSEAMRGLIELIARLATTRQAVLIVGETGSGKELVARAIHEESDRGGEAFVAVNCAMPTDGPHGSELFGHERGAFPGALRTRRGLFVESDGGTVFLDEVGDMPLPLQATLLRVLESGEVRPLGGEMRRGVDVRCIASTQTDLGELVRQGKFRKDLFFRLNVIPVRVPSLRERREDIPLLVQHFFARVCARVPHALTWSLTEDAWRVLDEHSWPGNVRELQNLVERLATTCASRSIDAAAVMAALAPPMAADPVEELALASVPLEELEERYTAAVLRLTQGNKPKAAAILGIDLSTLYRRAKRPRD